jgi:ketosteroid isomerase-like protein
MNLLLESYWPAILGGIIGEAILAVILLRTGRGVLLLPMAGVLVLALADVALVRWVPTERKMVAATLYDTAAALEANDLPRVLRHIAPEARPTRDQAEQVLGSAQIVELKIRCLEIVINNLTSPPTAKATFNVIVTGRDRRGEWGTHSRPGKLIVELRRQSDGWIITGHQIIEDPR